MGCFHASLRPPAPFTITGAANDDSARDLKRTADGIMKRAGFSYSRGQLSRGRTTSGLPGDAAESYPFIVGGGTCARPRRDRFDLWTDGRRTDSKGDKGDCKLRVFFVRMKITGCQVVVKQIGFFLLLGVFL